MGVLKTLRELDERDADCVMLSIEYLTEALTDDPNPSLSQRIPRVMLDHLTELHRLRDLQFHEDMEWLWNSPTMWELHPDA